MNTFLDYSASVVVHVLETSWQALVLACLVVLLTLLLRERLSARWRSALWLVVVVRLLMPFTMESPVSLFNLLPSEIAWSPTALQPVEASPIEPPTLPTDGMAAMDFHATQGGFSQLEIDGQTPDAATVSTLPGMEPTAASRNIQAQAEVANAESVPAWSTSQMVWMAVISLWILGTIVLALRLLQLMFRLHFLLRQCRRAEGLPVQAIFEAAQRELGLHRYVELLVSPRSVGPAVTGIFRPQLLLGESLSETLTPDELRLVFLHELSHVRRQDLLVERLWQLAKILHWFNPMVWLAAHRWQTDRELACDEAVLVRLEPTHRTNYGRAILRVMESLSTLRPVPGAVGVLMRRGFLANRIRFISAYRPLSRRWTALAIVLLLLLIPIGLTNAVGKANISSEKTEEVTEGMEKTSETETDSADATQLTTVTGRCIDEDGKPIAGAAVAAVGCNFDQTGLINQDAWDKILAETTTDHDGQYRLVFKDLATKRRYDYKTTIFARAKGTSLAWRKVKPEGGLEKVSITLVKEQPIRGRLLDEQGKPAVGVRILPSTVMETTTGTLIRNSASCKTDTVLPKVWLNPIMTDQDGRFVIRGIAPGCGVSLEVKGEENERFASQDLMINSGLPEERGEHDATYRPHIKNVKPGEEAVITLDRAKIFEGVVRYEDSGKPVPHARIKIGASQQELGGSLTCVSGQTDAEGRYRITPNPGIRFYLEAYPPDGTPYLGKRSDDVVWKDNSQVKHVDMTLPRGVWVRGKVIDSESKKPIAGACVQYEPSGKNKSKDSVVTGWQRIQSSDASGQFEIVTLPGPGHLLLHGPDDSFVLQEIGSNQLYNHRPGGRRYYAHAIERIDPKDGEEPVEITIPLKRGETIAGRIVNGKGDPVEEASIITRLNIRPTSPYWRADFGKKVFRGPFEI